MNHLLKASIFLVCALALSNSALAADICLADSQYGAPSARLHERMALALASANTGDTIHFGVYSGGTACPADLVAHTYYITGTTLGEHGLIYDGHGSAIRHANYLWDSDGDGVLDDTWPYWSDGSPYNTLQGLRFSGSQSSTATIIKNLTFDGRRDEQCIGGVCEDDPNGLWINAQVGLYLGAQANSGNRQDVVVENTIFRNSSFAGVKAHDNVDLILDGGDDCSTTGTYGIETINNHHGVEQTGNNSTVFMQCIYGSDSEESAKIERQVPTGTVQLRMLDCNLDKPTDSDHAVSWGVGAYDGTEKPLLSIDSSNVHNAKVSIGNADFSLSHSTIGDAATSLATYPSLEFVQIHGGSAVIENSTIHGFASFSTPMIDTHVVSIKDSVFVSPKDPITHNYPSGTMGYAIKTDCSSGPTSASPIGLNRHFFLENVDFQKNGTQNYDHILKLFGGNVHVVDVTWDDHNITDKYWNVISAAVGNCNGIGYTSAVWSGGGDCEGNLFTTGGGGFWPVAGNECTP